MIVRTSRFNNSVNLYVPSTAEVRPRDIKRCQEGLPRKLPMRLGDLFDDYLGRFFLLFFGFLIALFDGIGMIAYWINFDEPVAMTVTPIVFLVGLLMMYPAYNLRIGIRKRYRASEKRISTAALASAAAPSYSMLVNACKKRGIDLESMLKPVLTKKRLAQQYDVSPGGSVVQLLVEGYLGNDAVRRIDQELDNSKGISDDAIREARSALKELAESTAAEIKKAHTELVVEPQQINNAYREDQLRAATESIKTFTKGLEDVTKLSS